jgi:putative addiction module killer protein
VISPRINPRGHRDGFGPRKTEAFETWRTGLKDQRGKAKIVARIDRLALGNPGDVSPVGEGVSELRIHFGPGYRVYLVRREKAVVVLLCAGDKGSQDRDIAEAKSLAAELKDE